MVSEIYGCLVGVGNLTLPKIGFSVHKRRALCRVLGSMWKYWIERFSWWTHTVRAVGVNVECFGHSPL